MSDEKPLPCGWCGETAMVDVFSPGHWRVHCIMADCWEGPVMPGKRKAVRAWNDIMRALRDAKERSET